MERTHLSALGTLLESLARIFHHSLEKDDRAAYCLALSGLSFEAIQYACTQVLKHETFMPVPAIIRDYAKNWSPAYHTVQGAHLTDQQFLALREGEISSDEIRQLIQSMFPNYPKGEEKKPAQGYTPDHYSDLTYEPQTNTEEAKRKARAYLRTLKSTEE